MNKEEAQKRIENAERELAEAKAALLQPENPEPKEGEVWGDTCGNPILWNGDNQFVRLLGAVGEIRARCGGETRLGTFEEVYIERERVREVIRRALGSKDEYGDTLANILNIHHRGGKKAIAILEELLQ